MKKLKLYLDTSVLSHLFADDAPKEMADTLKFWEAVTRGEYEVFVSNTVFVEMNRTSEPKLGKMLKELNAVAYNHIVPSKTIDELAKAYVANGVLTQKSFDDCMHIASAVVENCDLVISWNFNHLVNYKTINKVKVVNALNHYKEMGIMTPTMLLQGV